MPELPEVETTVRGIAAVLDGDVLVRVEPRRADLRRPIPVDLRQRLTGARVTGLGRRAKYGLIETDRGDTLVFHLGMSGRWRVDPSEIETHDHLILETAGGRVLSLEADPAKCEAWRRNIEEAGLDDTAELIEGNAFEMLPAIDDVFDVVFIDAEKEDYEQLFDLARPQVEPGAVFVADNVLSHADTLADYSRHRQADPTLESVTVPLDRGLELSAVLRQTVQ